MHTLEQRERAVELYVGYGGKAAATTRELGHPKGREKLADWMDGLAPGQRRAAGALLTGGGPAREVAEAAGSSRCTLYKWRKELLQFRGESYRVRHALMQEG